MDNKRQVRAGVGIQALALLKNADTHLQQQLQNMLIMHCKLHKRRKI